MLGSVTYIRRANNPEVGKIYNIKISYLGMALQIPDFWGCRVVGILLGRSLEIPEMGLIAPP
jgi:hypothetical protein